jgi:UDP-2,3-diacylglucosamine hydrolase
MDDPVELVCGTRVYRAADDDREHTYLVSDLHVPMAGGDVLASFERLLVLVRRQAERTRLVVLGDLLAGIVNERQLRAVGWEQLIGLLRATVAAGVSVSVLHGNRDFMLGRRFAAATGCRVVAGGLALRLGARRTLALHGDELCTNDTPYQRSKVWLRSRVVRWLCAAMPLPLAAAVGARVRRASGEIMASGDQTRFAPVAQAVEAAFAAGYEVLVFGHVHTPGEGDFAGTSGRGRYHVLPAFDETPAFLLHTGGEELRFHQVDETRPRPQFPALRFAAAAGGA